MLVERIKVFFAKHKAIKWLIIMMILAGIIIVAWLLYQNCLEQSLKNVKISDTSKGIIGTLIGAVVGGSLSIIGTVYVSRKTQKAQSAVKRNNIIYKPLYNELNEIHQVILEETPYPMFIRFEKREQTIRKHPQYTVWGRIKMDARLFEVPKKLRKAMEKLYRTIGDYQQNLTMTRNELHRAYWNELNKIPAKDVVGVSNADSYLIPYLMSESKPKNDLLFRCEDDDETCFDIFWDNLIEISKNNSAFTNLKEIKIRWEKDEKYVLDLLSSYIQRVNSMYEGV